MAQDTRPRTVTTVADAVPLDSLSPRVMPRRILMCPPTFFEVKDANNEFMAGNIGGVDTARANEQWLNVKATFESCGFPVDLIEPGTGFEDMVFTANQVLPFVDSDGAPSVVIGKMAYPVRQREVPLFEEWFEKRGYKMLTLPGACERFEGGGDAVWHTELNLLWVGVGQRTSAGACDELVRVIHNPVVRLNLVSKKFYHLDTAFSVLDRDSVLFYPGAFDRDGLDLIHHYFKNVIEVVESDANNFACNALALNRNVLLQTGSSATCEALRSHGFEPREVDTSEFMKSGGSVFCMKQLVY